MHLFDTINQSGYNVHVTMFMYFKCCVLYILRVFHNFYFYKTNHLLITIVRTIFNYFFVILVQY